MNKAIAVIALLSGFISMLGCQPRQNAKVWQKPPVVAPGANCSEPPSDAIVLFDGSDLSQWVTADGNLPAPWKIENGYMEVTPSGGNIATKRGFGDCQLHIEWATPAEVKGTGQEPGNSGVFLMTVYEVQILESYQNETYFDGMAGAIFGQSPPWVNACKPPGQWQSFDIVFHRPHFKDTKCVTPARMTIFQNGVLIQDNWELLGTTRKPISYKVHADKAPLKLQSHHSPIRFRNIWIRELAESR